jgi:hypothetical protein
MKVVSAEAHLVEGQAEVRTYEALFQYVLAQVKANQANTDAAKLQDLIYESVCARVWSGN